MHRARPILLLVALATALPAFAGCLGGNEPVDVLATFYPMEFLAETIGGSDVTVGTLIPGGAEPHDWEPTVSDVTRLADATLVLAHHRSLEPWLDDLVAGLGNDGPTVVYTAGHLVEGDAHEHAHDDDAHDDAHDDEDADNHGNESADAGAAGSDTNATMSGDRPAHLDEDPHTWLDPVQFGEQAAEALEAMIAAFPEHGDAFVTRTNELLGRLNAVDDAYAARLADCGTRHIVTQHDAFAHLAWRYNFTVHAVSGLSPEAEPNPATVDRIVRLMDEHDIDTVFVEPLVDPGVMEAIARETGATVAVLNPLESRTSAEAAAGADHVDIMMNNLDALANAMGCT